MLGSMRTPHPIRTLRRLALVVAALAALTDAARATVPTSSSPARTVGELRRTNAYPGARLTVPPSAQDRGRATSTNAKPAAAAVVAKATKPTGVVIAKPAQPARTRATEPVVTAKPASAPVAAPDRKPARTNAPVPVPAAAAVAIAKPVQPVRTRATEPVVTAKPASAPVAATQTTKPRSKVFTTEGQPPKTGPDKATALLKRERKRRSDMGVASYYGAYFAGRETANGETFDPWAMTAAHRLLPLGTVLRVINLDNGRMVEVRVNDRGPYRHDRIIDVSHGAARRLGFEGSGVARVRLEVLKLGDGRRVRVPARRGDRSTNGPLADAGPTRGRGR